MEELEEVVHEAVCVKLGQCWTTVHDGLRHCALCRLQVAVENIDQLRINRSLVKQTLNSHFDHEFIRGFQAELNLLTDTFLYHVRQTFFLLV